MRKLKILSTIKETIGKYISNNTKDYILVTIIFVIGIFIRSNVYKQLSRTARINYNHIHIRLYKKISIN